MRAGTALAAILFLSILGMGAAAENVSLYIGGGVPLTNEKVPLSNGRFLWEPEICLSLSVGYRLGGGFEPGVYFARHGFNNGLSGYDEIDRTIYLVGFCGRYTPDLGGLPVRPFVITGSGLAVTKSTYYQFLWDYDGQYNSPMKITGQSEDIFVSVGLGGQYVFGSHWGGYIQAQYMSIHKDERSFFPVEVGFSVYF